MRRSPTPAAWLAAVLLPVALAAAVRPPDRPASDRPGGERPPQRPLVERPSASGERQSAEPWTIDDLVLAESASDWTISPDGTLAAWVKSTVGKGSGKEDEARVGNLWVTRLTPAAGAPESYPMTRGDEMVAQPAFSPDGRHLAFLSTRPGDAEEEKSDPEEEQTQLWVIPVRGGEAYPVTRFDREVIGFGWIDADTLLAVAKESPSAGEQRKKERQDTAIAVDDPADEPPVRLFTVSRDGERVRRLTSNEDWIDSVAISPDGRRAVVTAQQSLSYAFDSKMPPRTYLVDLQSGHMTQLFAGDGGSSKAPGPAKLLPHDVRWARDSSGFYFANERTRHPRYRLATVTELYYHDVKTGRTAPVDLGWERGLAESDGGCSYAPTADGFVALLAEGVHLRAARYIRTGRGFRRQELSGAHAASLDSLALGRDGRTLVYQTSSSVQPPQVYVARLDDARLTAERRLTDLNPGFRDKPKGKVEVARWKGARGEMVEGILYYPLDWRAGEKRPLVLDLHGGPAYADTDTWLADWEAPDILLRQRGAFVLKVNYHGSTGYGLDFVESIAGHYYELEIPDVEAGVDALVARGLVDPEKLGSMGWSNGGILTVELLTRSRRYKAAVVGAADVEWISDWGNVDFGATFDNYYFGAPPWEKPQLYIEKSPFFRLAQVTTPTLVYAGTADRDVPPHQAWSLFRALQQIGKAPTRLVLFPGEPHDLRRVAHQRRKLEEDLDWFDRYLFGRPPARREAVKEGTALAALLARTKAVRAGTAFGRRENGALVPETVPFHGHEVGRFEVTRAQLASFDPAVQTTPGSENLPATGIPFARAREYVAWLAKTTGKPFRLPTADEARDFADLAGSGGNTLDRWAGYAPTPHDRKEIEETLRTMPGEAPLLLPVGSLPGSGDDPVFDLDGNAAEWAVGADGKGVAVGPSAERPTDPRGDDPPSLAYTGLRVVLGR
jgi:dipeptidyl aminopeptidase/acylaminoacyl peptidase